MRVLRLSLVAATAVIAAACGDKVNVVGPSNTAGKIESVLVAPSSATISVGQAVTLTAAVNVDAGVTATVAWSSSSSAATLSSSSNTSTTVTGATSSPGVAVCATASATGAASVENCATVVVQPATTVVPAVLQIASITVAGNLNAPVPVPPAAVAGQINVSVNLNPGTEKMDSVVVMVNGKDAGIQTFSSGQAAALRSANGNGADQALQSTLVFSVNTAAYNIATGAVTYPNGPAAISVVGYGHQGTSAAVNTSSQGVNLLFGNVDGWIVTQTIGAGAPTVANAAGFNYTGGPLGSVTVSAIPVLYTGFAIASANVNFGTAACDASGSAQRTAVLVAPVAPAFAWTATFTRTAGTAAHVTDVNNYEFNAAVCVAANTAGGEGAAIASSLYTNNGTGPTAFVAGSAIPVVRLDDRAPGTPNLVQNPRIRQNGWINAQVGILAGNSGSATTTNNVINTGFNVGVGFTPGAADAGVGGGGYQLRAAAPGAGGIVDPARTATPLTVATAVIGTGALAPTLTATSLCGIWTAIDALGNESNLPAAGTVCTAPAVASNTTTATGVNFQLFGVDIAPPTITMSAGSIAAGAAGAGNTGANIGTELQVTVVDTGVVGNSGMLGGTPVLGTVTVRTAAAGLTAAQLCPVGTVAAGVCTASSTGFAPSTALTLPFVTTNVIAAQTIIGYYTFNAQSIDAAGNVSTNTVTRVIDYNPAANVPSLTASLFNTPLTGPTATFTATGSSGNTTVNGPTTFFDLWQVGYNLAYPAASLGAITATALVYPSTTINTFNTAPEVNSNVPVAISIPGFIRQVQTQTSACNVALTTTAVAKPTGLNEALLDMVGNTSGNVNTVIPPASVTTGVSFLGAAAPQQVATFLLSNGVTEDPTAGGCPSLGAGANSVKKVSGGGTSVDAASITLTADAYGPTATFNAPFAQVNFYVYNANTTFLELVGSTTTFSTTDDGSTQGRQQRYSFAWTPGTKTPISGTLWTAAGILSAGGGQSSAACAVGGSLAKFYAVGVTAAGDALFTPVSTNGNVCITTAP